MEKYRLKRGPKGVPLEREKQVLLKKMMHDDVRYKTVAMLAGAIGITYNQLYKPLVGYTNCSPKSHKAITRFLERQK